MSKKKIHTPPTPEELNDQVQQLNEIFPFADGSILKLHVQTIDNPRDDAPRYEVETIQEIFALVNEENVDRFISDLRVMFKSNIASRELMTTIAKAFGDPNAATSSAVNIHRFTWIDDLQ